MDKLIGDDFKEGKITLPVIIAFKQSNCIEKIFWKETLKHKKQTDQIIKESIKVGLVTAAFYSFVIVNTNYIIVSF